VPFELEAEALLEPDVEELVEVPEPPTPVVLRPELPELEAVMPELVLPIAPPAPVVSRPPAPSFGEELQARGTEATPTAAVRESHFKVLMPLPICEEDAEA
jgi:hypothetical protein